MTNLTNTMIVQKFGGTSLGTADRLLNVANIVESSWAKGSTKLIVVLSAMSSYKKSEGTTSRLLKAAEEVLVPGSTAYIDIVTTIENEHVAHATEALERSNASTTLINDTIRDIRLECGKLRSFLEAAEVIEEVSPRSRDMVISYGEKLSCRIFTSILKARGLDAAYVNLEKVIDKHFDPQNLDQTFYDYLTQRMTTVVGKYSANTIPVVTGYFGPVPGSLISSIGRGYTDLTAALLSVGFQAQEFQIWKEVDGIFTADPRKVPSAKLLSFISPDEAAELTYYGSEVIHPFTMDQVIRKGIPIRIKNTFKPETPGTMIMPEFVEREHELSTASASDSSTKRHPTAVTIKDNVTILNIHSNRKSVSHGFFRNIFETLDAFGIVVDLISTSEVHVSMALNISSKERLERCVQQLKKYGSVDTQENMCILSLVGKQMKNMVGMSSKLFTVLAQHDINIEMISQGASEINISCVLDMAVAETALRAVHNECIISD